MIKVRTIGLMAAGVTLLAAGMVVEPGRSEAARLSIGFGGLSIGFGGPTRVRPNRPIRPAFVPRPKPAIIVEDRRRRRSSVVVVVPETVVERRRQSSSRERERERERTAPTQTKPAPQYSSAPSNLRLPGATTSVGAIVPGMMGDAPAAGAAAPVGNFIWNHNSSVMRMAAEGETVRFYYEVPREGLSTLGISQGTLLFEGKVAGGTSYSGNVTTFSKECGPATFPVTGQGSPEGNRLELTGPKPNRDGRCKVVGTRNETLVFDLQSR